MQEKDFTLPVVIVGKDRTRLVCKVIDSVKEHFKGCNLQFIHVSDNSREGHIEAIRKHLTEIGENDFLVMSTNADRHGVGAAMNIGLAEAFRRFSVAFLLENDNICERDIDMNLHARIISETNIGAFTFKTPEKASNIYIEYDTIDGINISRRYARHNPSYAISNGSLMLHKRMYETIGSFKENCSPEEQEIDLIVKYNAIPKQEIIDRRLVVAHDSEIEHKDGEIFFHAGLHSFKGFDNNIDEKYLKYNNDELDKEACEMAISNNGLILPVVIVGKDRTRMTCAVIDHIKKHIKNATPYFICVSDRSRPGHDIVVENHLKEIGETEYQVLRTLPEENRYGWGCAINIGLDCAFDICEDSDFALVVDNDWLLQRDLDMDKYGYAFSFSNMGAITFKSVNAGTNVALTEKTLADGITYLFRSAHETLSRFSFTAEIGCMLITRQMRSEYREFKENCKTDETEWAFCNWYNSLTCEDKNDKHLWFANDRDMYHTELNGEGHVFTHVGLHSQHDGPHKWKVPEQYLYLSDENADAKICHDAYWIPVAQCEDKVSESSGQVKIDWEKYFDKVYCMFILDGKNERMPRLKKELARVNLLDSDVFSWRFDVNTDSDIGITQGIEYPDIKIDAWKKHRYDYIRILKESQLLGFRRILIIEDDIAFLKDKNAIVNVLETLPSDPIIQMDKTVWWENVKRCVEKNKKERNPYIRSNFSFPSSCCTIFNREGMDIGYSVIEKQRCIADQIGMFAPEKIAVATKNIAVQVIYKNNNVFAGGDSPSKHNGYRNQGIDEKYSEYAVPEGYDMTQVYEEKDEDRSVPSEKRSSNAATIDWSKYFDKIYCFHYLPQDGRLKRLNTELRRIGILDSNIFEYRYTVPSRYDNILLSSEAREPRWSKNIWVANLGLATLQALKEAKYQGCRRVLILENDIAFLRDMKKIREILDDIPYDADYCQLDKFVSPGQKSGLEGDCESLGTHFFRPKDWYTGADCIALKGKGIDEFIRVMEEKLTPNDMVIRQMHCTYAAIKRPMCIQLLYNQCYNLTLNSDISYMDSCYKSQDVDYRDYAVPDGYDFGMVVKDSKNCQSRNSNSKPFVQKGRKFVSVYAIAKNEEPVAKRWYDCVKEADEVCVLDTGSTDNTVKILRDLGAKVEVKTYDDWSFAVARNDSMKLVSPDSEILFTLDLDETISPGWRKILEDAWISEEEKGHNPVGMLYKYIWSFTPDGKEMQSFSVRKVHAKGTGLWKYRCHELLIDVNGFVFFNKDFVVEHHQNRGTNRSKYLDLLAKDAKEMPDDDRSAYYYARELMYEGRWHEAITEFKRHLTLPSAGWRCERASSMRNIAYCYKQLKSEDKNELWLWKSAEEDPTNREATFFLGEIAMERKDYRTAVKVFDRCLAIKEPSLEYISMPVVWSARPWFLYAQALWWTGHWDDAVEASRKATEIEPSNQEVQKQYLQMKGTRDNARNNS